MRQTGLTGGVASPAPIARQGQPGAAAEARPAGPAAGHAPASGPQARPGRALVNGRVLPMGPPRAGRPGWEHEADAIAWEGDTIVAVGTSPEVEAEARRRGLPVEDLGGRVVLPGFVDAHTHFLHVGVKRTRPDLRGATTLKEALARLATFLRDHPGAHHVIGEGWDESEWTAPAPGEAAPDGRPRRPTRHDLDAVIAAASKAGHGPPDRPVVLRRICGHIAVASTGALPAIRARWDDDAAVDLATGALTEAPSLYLNEVLASTPEELDRAVQKACAVAHRIGVTTVGDYSQAPYRAALQRAAARGDLTVRVASSVYVQQLGDEVAAGFRTGRPGLAPQDLGAGARDALRPGSGRHAGAVPGRDGGDRAAGGSSPWLRDGGLKVFLDGSLGGHTAHLREPYLDEPRAAGGGGGSDPHAGHGHGPAGAGGARPGCGSRIWTDGDLDRFFGMAHANGIQVHAHAIGDAAIDQGLDAYARLAAHESLEGRGWAAEPLPRVPPRTRGEEDGDVVPPAALGRAGADGGAGRRGDAAPTGSRPGGRGLRHRFEHYEIVHDDQVARTVELGLVSSSQPNFVGEWSAKGGMYESRLGDRFRLNNRFRDFVDAGLALAFGSDGMPFGPLLGLHSALHHPDARQRLAPREAVWHYTTAAAWALHWEDAVGALLPGMKADLLVLDQGDLDDQPQDWVVRETIVGGLGRGGNERPIPSM